MLENLLTFLYAAALLLSIVAVHMVVRRPYRPWAQKLRERLVGYKLNWRHVLAAYATVLARLYLFMVVLYWYPMAVLILFVESFMWLYFFAYIVPILRQQHAVAEMLKTDPNITAASRSEFACRRPQEDLR